MPAVLVDVNGVNWGYKTAWLFFATGAVTCLIICFYVSELSQRDPAELDEMYEKDVPAWKMRKFVIDGQMMQQEQRRSTPNSEHGDQEKGEG